MMSVAIDNRYLIKEGDLRLMTVQRTMGSAFHRKFSSIMRQKAVNASLFLFNDLFMIAKKRSNQRLMVDEHCPLSWIRVEVDPSPFDINIVKYYPAGTLGANGNPKTAPGPGTVTAVGRLHSQAVDSQFGNEINGHSDDRNSPRNRESETIKRAMSIPTETGDMTMFPFRLIIESPNHPRSVYNLQAKTLSERERWIDALSPKRYGIAENLVYKVWDCPQVLITRSHSTNEGDELELKEGDQASILVSLNDSPDQGWYKGMLSDGRIGWFPSGICVEVQDALMKRENMRNFMLLEEARAAYRIRKAREQFSEFPRLKDVARSRVTASEQVER
ncbi:unnamed protein product [Echinostoma caproni]|uniref:SH3 domain-containing protein n=1 Tax=Echinostoma caproni TaxID=27848 RepID=A0A183A5H5_9TREM|nr:unnamed protein product [Echinostoma caproni]